MSIGPAPASARRMLAGIFVTVFVLIAMIGILAAPPQWKQYAVHGYNAALAAIQSADPILFWVSLTLLPLLGFPVAPLLITAGVKFPIPIAFAVAASSILVNLFLSHFIGNRMLRAILTRVLQRLGHQIPSIPDEQHRRVVILIRITPGVPVFIANYLLVLGGVRLVDFMLISFPIQLVFASGFLLLGGSLVGGNLSWALIVIVLIIALKLFVQSRLTAAKKRGPSVPTIHN